MAFYWFELGSRSVRPIIEAAASTNVGVGVKPKTKNPYQKASPPAQRERRPALTAAQIMRSPVKTLAPDTPFADARQLFHRSRFRHVPIVNADGKLVGVISDRDVLREAAAASTTPVAWLNEVVAPTRTIEDFMIKRVLTATPAAEIRQIAKAMFEERIGSMPIVNEEEKLVGIITRSDILRTIVNNAPLELWI